MRRVTRITGVGLGVEAGMILGTAGLALLVRMLKIKCGHLFLYTFEMKYFMQGVLIVTNFKHIYVPQPTLPTFPPFCICLF